MKKKALLAIASLFCLGCCGKSDKEETPSQSYPVQFTIRMKTEVHPFLTTKGIPPLDIPEPAFPGNDTEQPYAYIDYLVYPAGTPSSPMKHKQYTLEDTDFGIVYDTLPPGNYHLCFLAHSDKEVSINGQTAAFKTMSDTFLAFFTQTIHPDAEAIQDIDLARVVGRVEFVAAEAVPESLGNFKMDITGFQDKIDLSTGLGISENVPYIQTYTPQPGDIGKTGLTYAFYTFIPTSESPLSARLTAYNKEGGTLRSRDIGTITPIRNRVVRYTGKLYTPTGVDDTFTLHISNEGKWDDPVENELKE